MTINTNAKLSMSAREPDARLIGFGWLLVAVPLVATVLAALMPGAPLAKSMQGLQSLALVLFVPLHLSLAHGWRAPLLFLPIAFASGFLYESTSIATGFPFGFFAHGDSLGLKIGAVPIIVATSYFFLGYPAWMMAKVIDGAGTDGRARWTTPLIATVILAGYDLCYDPIGASIQGAWQYRSPTGFNGVPLSNFLGWLLNGWTIFQLWALVERRLRPAPALSVARYWAQPPLIWVGVALQFPLLYAFAPPGTSTIGERTWVTADIYETATIMAIFTMLFAALLTLARLRTAAASSAGSEQ
jgi:uncharacterized membrane protein